MIASEREDQISSELDLAPGIEPDGRSSSRTARFLRPGVDADVSVHVFGVSAALVGVCLTVIGIIRIGTTLEAGYSTIADELLAIDSICFLAACLLAYSSMRSPDRTRAKRLEGYADRLFIAGMAAMCAACALVAFSLI